MTTPSEVPDRPRLPETDRADRLDNAIAQVVEGGGRLESRRPHHAVVVYGGGNILLHITFAALTFLSHGFFVFPWIVWANTIREHRVTVGVGPYGDIIRTR